MPENDTFNKEKFHRSPNWKKYWVRKGHPLLHMFSRQIKNRENDWYM